MRTGKAIFLTVGGLIIIVLIAILAISLVEQRNAESSQIVYYEKSEVSRPKVKVAYFSSNLGQMKLKDEKEATFTIENIGDKSLFLSSVRTSCDCTFAKITIGNATSAEFNMHSKTEWVGEVKPKEKATLTAIYRPFIMPVSGPVSREVYIATNDPNNPRLTFTISAIVK